MMFRIRDLALAVLGLLVLSPVFLIIILLLRLTQEKVFFRQLRGGKDRKPFFLIKFSTLYDADPGEEETAALESRLTPVGRYLRAWSLDELPQLWNVLKGEMSLVGPRPLLAEYLPLYSEKEQIRHEVLPGITGWAQVHGRNTLSFKERFQFDIWYVQNRSFCLDMRILRMTIRKILRREGVYLPAKKPVPKYDGTN